jgi:hypothetical protein
MANLPPKAIDTMPITEELSSHKKDVLMFHIDLPDSSMKRLSPELALQEGHQGCHREENWS